MSQPTEFDSLKLGDTVYQIYPWDNRTVARIIDMKTHHEWIDDGGNTKSRIVYYVDGSWTNSNEMTEKRWGVTFFPTQAEAAQACQTQHDKFKAEHAEQTRKEIERLQIELDNAR